MADCGAAVGPIGPYRGRSGTDSGPLVCPPVRIYLHQNFSTGYLNAVWLEIFCPGFVGFPAESQGALAQKLEKKRGAGVTGASSPTFLQGGPGHMWVYATPASVTSKNHDLQTLVLSCVPHPFAPTRDPHTSSILKVRTLLGVGVPQTRLEGPASIWVAAYRAPCPQSRVAIFSKESGVC